jgi:hypothetical protein
MTAACSNDSTLSTVSSDPSAKEYLAANEKADIFQWKGVIYQKSERESTQEYSLGTMIVKIENQTMDHREFKDGASSILPVGTEIYEAGGENAKQGERILLAVVDGVIIPYSYQIEG